MPVKDVVISVGTLFLIGLVYIMMPKPKMKEDLGDYMEPKYWGSIKTLKIQHRGFIPFDEEHEFIFSDSLIIMDGDSINGYWIKDRFLSDDTLIIKSQYILVKNILYYDLHVRWVSPRRVR